MINHDPKHGRWILPLIIVAMVILTYTFVNGIEPADSPTGSASDDEEPPFPTTPTSSTTTLPPDVAAFMVTLDILDNQLEAFRAQVESINTRWNTREIDFSSTREAFVDVRADLEQWANSVATIEGVPPALAEGHVDLVIEAGDLAPKVDDIVVGLEAPDDGTLRDIAVTEFKVEIQQVADVIEAIRQQAASGSVAPDDTTGTTTEGDTTEA